MKDEIYYEHQIIEIFQCNQEFLKQLEEEELISSQLDANETKTYDSQQLERIRIIQSLMEELEVNLPGVEVILEMRENMIRMQQQFQSILETLVAELKTRMESQRGR